MICPFCGMSAIKMSGSKTVRCMRVGIKWVWYTCSNFHEWGHRRVS